MFVSDRTGICCKALTDGMERSLLGDRSGHVPLTRSQAYIFHPVTAYENMKDENEFIYSDWHEEIGLELHKLIDAEEREKTFRKV